MVKVPTNPREGELRTEDETSRGDVRHHAHRFHSRVKRLIMIFLLLGVVAATVVGALVEWPRPAPVVPRAPTPTPAFLPKLGDVGNAGDLDDGMTVALGTTPAFQFKIGGYTLKGITVDARTGKAVSGVSIWLTVPPAIGQRTAPELHTVSAVDGTFSFAHLAADTYTLAAARYYVQFGQPEQPGQSVYPEVVQAGVTLPRHASVRLSLAPQAVPGTRHLLKGGAQNLILLDLSGIYAESWFDDPELQLEARNMRALAASGAQATQVVAPYGWHPADQYALLSGTYPAWRVYDPWPHLTPWGRPDGVDTTFWYNSDPSAMEFGQQSLFDVALDYGMSTAALGGSHYMLSDVSTRGVQTAQVGLTFDSASWLAAAEHLMTNMANNANGFVFYSELDPPFGASGSAGAAPDAPGGAYARAMQADDELLGLLQHWLASQGLLSKTVILVTASEAQVNETTFDNYYGMGPAGRGSSLHVPLVISGPGVATGATVQQPVSSFAVAATALRSLCLPLPAGSRVPALASLFDNRCP